ncbi:MULTISPECIES: DUF305 domain-containing protein [Streptomyces]|uniref:DUF305 domain-containing protein n=1 Tax=Streptomyces TaxID=1883 RepID=UPI000F7A3DC0|nr:DUF305 domain-containing protein [Streptomyces sp. WAC07149]RSS98739.1 DUF305 domain-containing protein [Streptomyces sp. WAC07149]GLX23414.1 DUF305 domain-containing protein [Streptomyces lavendulae subsp. lavendulae]GLX31290.1 DUF305 domain-containing protein [Streptomyces lavendulae subsp. lavendulae]
MTRTYWAAGAAVVLAVLFAVGATVATANGPDGRGDRAAPAAPALYSPDAGFARDMAVHHQQAVEMSFIVRDRTQDEPVRGLAYDIANTQANQRGMLLGWLDLWGLPKVVADEPPMSWMQAGEEHGGHAGHGAAKPGALMPGMATKEELERLGAANGRDAEVLYLQLMTDHHKGGVAMAEGCARQCATPAEKALAQGMVEAQQSELKLMEDMLRRRGAAPR